MLNICRWSYFAYGVENTFQTLQAEWTNKSQRFLFFAFSKHKAQVRAALISTPTLLLNMEEHTVSLKCYAVGSMDKCMTFKQKTHEQMGLMKSAEGLWYDTALSTFPNAEQMGNALLYGAWFKLFRLSSAATLGLHRPRQVGRSCFPLFIPFCQLYWP